MNFVKLISPVNDPTGPNGKVDVSNIDCGTMTALWTNTKIETTAPEDCGSVQNSPYAANNEKFLINWTNDLCHLGIYAMDL